MLHFETIEPTTLGLLTRICSFTWFEDAEQQPDPVSLNGVTWEEVKDKISFNAIDFTKKFLK